MNDGEADKKLFREITGTLMACLEMEEMKTTEKVIVNAQCGTPLERYKSYVVVVVVVCSEACCVQRSIHTNNIYGRTDGRAFLMMCIELD